MISYSKFADFDNDKSINKPKQLLQNQRKNHLPANMSPQTQNEPAPVQTVPKDDGKFVLTHKEENVFYITLNRPDDKNAITPDMYRLLGAAFREGAEMQDVSVTVLKSKGDDYYSSGTDLFTFVQSLKLDVKAATKEGHEIYSAFLDDLIDHPKLLVALVQGPAVGIAATSLGLFDAVFASDKATFHTPFPTLGLTPEGCSTVTFPAIMGHLKAADMLCLGHKASAHRAKALNLVTEVLPHWTFEQDAQQKINEYAALPPLAALKTKSLLRRFERTRLHEVNKVEAASLAACWETKEFFDAVNELFQLGWTWQPPTN